MVEVAPSILAADFENLENEVKSVVEAGANYIHIDVMDGEFVINETPGIEMYERAREATDKIIDVHLMVENPENWIEDFSKSDIITFHIEAVDEQNAYKIIEKLHELDIKVGIAIKPETPVQEVIKFLDSIDMVLIMTVEPGAGGQKLIEKCIDKVIELREIDEFITIEVDGGINLENFEKLKNAGANIFVAGTAVFKAQDRKYIIDKINKSL